MMGVNNEAEVKLPMCTMDWVEASAAAIIIVMVPPRTSTTEAVKMLLGTPCSLLCTYLTTLKV